MLNLLIVFVSLSTIAAFSTNSVKHSPTTTLYARSKSVPFAEQPAALTGQYPGDVGFDPLGLSNIFPDIDWGELIVPKFWKEPLPRRKITTVEWMRESEVKHGRFAMLAVVGWIAVDLGLRLPFSNFNEIPNSLAAHKAAVENGSLGVLLNFISAFELFNGAAIYDQSKGSGREPGDFSFDPLGFSKDSKSRERFALNEVKNGRLAMLAFAGIVTQAALYPEKSFPYF